MPATINIDHNTNQAAALTQKEKILAHLRTGLPLTSLDALFKFNCSRLAARILDLRRDYIPIEKRMVETETGKHVAEYIITDPDHLD